MKNRNRKTKQEIISLTLGIVFCAFAIGLGGTIWYMLKRFPVYVYNDYENRDDMIIIGKDLFQNIPFDGDRITVNPIVYQDTTGNQIDWVDDIKVYSCSPDDNKYFDKTTGLWMIGSPGERHHSILISVKDDIRLENNTVSYELVSSAHGSIIRTYRVTPKLHAKKQKSIFLLGFIGIVLVIGGIILIWVGITGNNEAYS